MSFNSNSSSSSSSSSSSNIPNQFISTNPSIQTQSSPSNLQAKPPGWVHFLAGGLGGMCGAIVTAPFDLVKTRLQSSIYQTSSSSNLKLEPLQNFQKVLFHFKDTGRLIRDIQRTEGLRALFRGLGPTLAGAIPARSINFYVYGTGKEFYSQFFLPTTSSFQPHQDTSSLVHIFSAITAGIATSTATNPIWVIKTRLQLEIPSPSAKLIERSTHESLHHPKLKTKDLISNQSIQTFLKPSLECMKRIYQQEGLVGFYRGLSASYLGVIEGTIQWTLYEKFKRFGRFDQIEPNGLEEAKESWIHQICSAGSAKLLATGITYPHEVVRTRMRQKRPMGIKVYKYDGLLTTFKTVFVEEGIRSFYGGLPAHLLRVVPNAIVMYTVYETALSISRKNHQSLES